MIFLGIDPGTVRVGYGVIEKNGGTYKYKESGLLKIENKEQKSRLLKIEEELEKIIKRIKPDKAGVEKIFFSKNKKTAIKVAEARGVIISTLHKNNIDLIELSPTQIKLSVAGNGRSSKEAVAKMVNYFLNINTNKLIDDETDAIAIAIAAGDY
ncbi:MAG: crossover junction endodeoxyribonuclease RuvC [Candidatus Paceibacterota bacterium]